MRIIHCMLANFYVDNYLYQENILPSLNKKDGHEVLIIASTFSFDRKYDAITEPLTYVNNDGIKVIRLPYKHVINKCITEKVRSYDGAVITIQAFNPDIIYFHGIQAYELLKLTKYIKTHPNVRLVCDNHADIYNSGTSFISKWILHKLFYRAIYKLSEKYIHKVYCTTYETMLFAKEYYSVNTSKLEYLPLGGMLIGDERYADCRKKGKNELGIQDGTIVFMASGKINKLKKIEVLLEAFTLVNNPDLKLIIAGSLSKDLEDKVLSYLKKDKRIIFLGWLSPEKMETFLCSTDVYIQPGGQSVSMQNALCCRCAVALTSVPAHKYLLGDVPYYIDNLNDMKRLFENISNNRELLALKRKQSYAIAVDKLDYVKLSRIYLPN